MATTMREIMSPAPVCMGPADSVADAALAMRDRAIGTVLVLTGGQLSGLVTDRDITTRVLAEGRDPGATTLAEICSDDLAVLGPDDGLERASRLVRERAVRRIPIVEDGVPVGVVSAGDLALANN